MTDWTKVKAIIFDMDGVFVDTEPVVFTVFRRVFDPMGVHLTDNYQFKFIGKPTPKNLLDIERDFGITLDKEHIMKQLKETYQKVLDETEMHPQPGINAYIQWAQNNGRRLGLCTTSPRRDVDAVFRKLNRNHSLYNPDKLFDAVVTGNDVTHKKPHPEPYQKVIARINVPADFCIVFEDSLYGICSAKAAGCTCIGIRRFYNRHIDFSEADEIMTVDAFSELGHKLSG